MGIKGALNQNYYMDSNEVMDAGERIRFVMAKWILAWGKRMDYFAGYPIWQTASRQKQGAKH